MALRHLAPLALLLSVLAFQACNTTPTLPLPPPVVSSISTPDANGLVSVRGTALQRAYVSVLNDNSNEGVITRADDAGAFSAEIAAQAGDRLELWQEQDGELGEHVDIGVPRP